MRPFTVVLVGLMGATAASAQPPQLPFARVPALHGGFGGVSPEQFFQSQVLHATNQLLSELGNLRTETGQLRVNPPVKVELVALADRAVREARALRDLAVATSDRRRLIRADNELDRSVDAFIARCQQLAVGSPRLANAIARAQYEDQQLHAIVGKTDGDRERACIPGTAAAVVDQVDNLRELARNEFPATQYTAQLDRSVRSFGFRVSRLARNLETGGTIPAAIADYLTAQAQWRACAAGLEPLSVNPEVRIQLARVDGLFRLLGEQVGIELGPIAPGDPGFGFLARGMFACAAGEGGGPRVSVFVQVGGPALFDFYAYDPRFRGGVRVAVADLNGDAFPELIAAPGGPLPGQPGLPPLVRVFDGRTMGLISEFLAYDRTWTGGVQVAATNLTRQGRALVVTGADVGAGPHVRAFDLIAGKEVASFYAYDSNYRGGVRVALGDVDGDGLPDIVTAPGPQHPPQIKVFAGTNARLLANWMAYDNDHAVGAYVATADLTKNGRADVIVGPDVNGCGIVRVFDPLRGRKIGEVTPYPAKFRGGVRVAAHDVNGDGVPDVVCAPGPDGPAPVRVFDGRHSKPIGEFFPFERTFGGGVFIGAR